MDNAEKLATALANVDVAARDLRDGLRGHEGLSVLSAVDLIARGIRSAALSLDALGPVKPPILPVNVAPRARLSEALRLMKECAAALDAASLLRFHTLTVAPMNSLMMRAVRKCEQTDFFQLALTNLS